MRPLALLLVLLLCGFDWPGRVDRLLAELERPTSEPMRRDLLRLLGTLDDPAAQEALARAAQDASPAIRAEALRGLMRARDARHGGVVSQALKDGDAGVRRAAVEAVAALRPPDAVALLTRSLSDSEPSVRAESARVLGVLGDAQAVPALAAALDDGSTDVRVAAARALAALGDERGVAPLVSKARDGAPELREAVVEALQELGGERATQVIAQALTDPSDPVVLAGMRAVAERGIEPWRATLEELTESPRPHVRTAAAALLARSRQQRPARPSGEEEWLRLLERTASASPDEAPALLAELERKLPRGEPLTADPLLEWRSRVPVELHPRLIRLVGQSGAQTSVRPLLALLPDAPRALQLALLEALLALGAHEGAVALVPLLERPDSELRDQAARTLRQVATAGELPALLRLLRAQPRAVRRASLQAIEGVLERKPAALAAELRKALLEALGHALEDVDDVVFGRATRCLAHLGDHDAAALLGAAEVLDRPLRRISLLRAAAFMPGQPGKTLRHVSDDASSEVRASALSAAALAGDAMNPKGLAAQARSARWPVGPSAAFALAYDVPAPDNKGAAAKPSEHGALLCSLLEAREPWTRANVLAGLSRLPALDCADADGLRWLTQARAPSVRLAAAVWARARLRVHADARIGAALARCSRSEREPAVREVCAGKTPSPTAADMDGEVRGLQLASGFVLVSAPDASADPSWPRVPSLSAERLARAPYGRE